MKSVKAQVRLAWLAGAMLAWTTGAQAQVEPVNEAKWYVSPGIGAQIFEGDEEVQSGMELNLRVGYDWSEWWTLETSLFYCPTLKENFRTDWATGAQISRLQEIPGNEGETDTYALGLALDGLFHFTRWERLDPYLSFGAGVTTYGAEMSGGSTDASLRFGGGVMYHFNDAWAVRADARMFIAGNDTEANEQFDGGVVWTWGTKVPSKLVAVGGPLDSDGDGLSDARESELGTDPYDPDTDDDELTDGQEVLQYKTDPLNPDCDYDGLRDGQEVLKYQTNPLDRDTDDGGVADGHEVIEDSTNPLHGPDDLLLFELNIQFDYDRVEIKPVYFEDLNVIAKVLKRNPEATARIEGHADKLKKSNASYNRRLSQRRAQSVLTYLSDVAGIAKGRMEAHGYGFDRPKEANDPVNGNPANRRVEVYIRGADAEKAAREQMQKNVKEGIVTDATGVKPE